MSRQCRFYPRYTSCTCTASVEPRREGSVSPGESAEIRSASASRLSWPKGVSQTCVSFVERARGYSTSRAGSYYNPRDRCCKAHTAHDTYLPAVRTGGINLLWRSAYYIENNDSRARQGAGESRRGAGRLASIFRRNVNSEGTGCIQESAEHA